MFVQFLSAICALAIVIVGILVMTRALTLEQLAHNIWRSSIFLALAFSALCFLKTALLPILICGLVWLQNKTLWALSVILALIGAMFLVRAPFLRPAVRNVHSKREKEKL
jgi:hypothetical protein